MGLRAQKIEWVHDSDSWYDNQYGFFISKDFDSGEFLASWGEGPEDICGTLEEAKAWCQNEIDGWVQDHVKVKDAPADLALKARSDAWLKVCETLCEVTPEWCRGEGSGVECAVRAIRTLAAGSRPIDHPSVAIGAWLSAALEDPNAGEEFKHSIRVWMDAGMPTVDFGGGWISFDDEWPPESPALDDPNVKTRDRVLVTNALRARDRMGRMSHVWLGVPQKAGDEVICFSDADRRIYGLTHWKPINPATEVHQ